MTALARRAGSLCLSFLAGLAIIFILAMLAAGAVAGAAFALFMLIVAAKIPISHWTFIACLIAVVCAAGSYMSFVQLRDVISDISE